jgi:hypothetical protein
MAASPTSRIRAVSARRMLRDPRCALAVVRVLCVVPELGTSVSLLVDVTHRRRANTAYGGADGSAG